MIPVYVYGEEAEYHALVKMANAVQQSFCFSQTAQTGAAKVHFSSRLGGPVLHVHAEKGIDIAMRQSKGISHYAGIQQESYLLTFSMLGLLQWRALQLNPLLHAEDLYHGDDRNCLFARRKRTEYYALLFENPQICRYCYHFYEQLCPSEEVQSLKEVVSAVQKQVRNKTGCGC